MIERDRNTTALTALPLGKLPPFIFAYFFKWKKLLVRNEIKTSVLENEKLDIRGKLSSFDQLKPVKPILASFLMVKSYTQHNFHVAVNIFTELIST